MLGLFVLVGVAIIFGCGFWEIRRLDQVRDPQREFDP